MDYLHEVKFRTYYNNFNLRTRSKKIDVGIGAIGAIGTSVVGADVAISPTSSAPAIIAGSADATASALSDVMGVDTKIKPSTVVSLGSTPPPQPGALTGIAAYQSVQSMDNLSISMDGVTVATNSARSQFSISMPNGSTYYVALGMDSQNGLEIPANKQLQDMMAMMMLKLMNR